MKINHPIARLVIRDEGKDLPPTFGIMACLHGQGFFEKGMVYEVRETADTINIVKLGRSAVAGEGQPFSASPIPAHWSENIADIVCKGAGVFGTWEEVEALNSRRRDEL